MNKRLKKETWQHRIIIVACILFFVLVFAFPTVINMRPQIQTKLLVTVLGLDRAPSGELELSGIAVMPMGGTDTASIKSITVEHKGNSIGENLEGLSEIYGREIELGLCGLVVVGQSLANENLLDHFEFLISSGFVSPGTYITFSPNAKAKEVLSIASQLNPSSAEILSSVVEYNATSNNISTITLLQFVSQTNSKSHASVIPQIIFDESENESQKQEGNKSKEEQEQGQSGEKESMKTAVKSLTQTALFNNGKKVGAFTPNQTFVYDLAKSDATQGLFVIDDFTVQGENLGKVECFVYGKNFKQKAEFSQGVPTLTYYPEITLQLYDQHRIIRKWKEMGMDENGITEPLLRQAENKLKVDFLSAITECKNSGADVFLIEDEFYKKTYKQYKQYKKDHPEFLSEVVVNIQPIIKFK